MPGFCVNCGAPVLGAFCNQCGSKTIQPGTTVQSSAAAPVVPSTSVPASGASLSPSTATYQAVTPVVTPAPVNVVTNPPPVMTMAKQSSGVGKAFLWIGLILLVLFLGIAGSTVYGYYWAKHKITSIASAVTGGVTQETKVVDHGDSCKLLSASDLQKGIGSCNREDR